MWCDDCNRCECRCCETCSSCFCFPCCCGALEVEYSAQRADEMMGWNDIWPPPPPAFKVERILRKDGDFCFDQGEYYPREISMLFTESETIRVEVGNQVFVRDSNNNWRSVIDHDA